MPSRGRVTSIARRPVHRAAATLATVAVLAACTATSDGPEWTGASSVSPREAHLDLSGLPMPRAPVCSALPEESVEQALAGSVADTGHYGNGDEFEVLPGQVDISHEYGCEFRAADDTAARVWIFARPVTRSEAGLLVRRAHRGRGCAFPVTAVFGTPGLTSVCEVALTTPEPGGRPAVTAARARFEGLFAETWVGCEVSEPLDPSTGGTPAGRDDVVQRAEQWCTEVVTTVSAAS